MQVLQSRFQLSAFEKYNVGELKTKQNGVKFTYHLVTFVCIAKYESLLSRYKLFLQPNKACHII